MGNESKISEKKVESLKMPHADKDFSAEGSNKLVRIKTILEKMEFFDSFVLTKH